MSCVVDLRPDVGHVSIEIGNPLVRDEAVCCSTCAKWMKYGGDPGPPNYCAYLTWVKGEDRETLNYILVHTPRHFGCTTEYVRRQS
jgi:hypothetical protein